MNDPTTSDSTTHASEPASEQPLYISPVLRRLDSKSRPQPSPACETCPAPLWFRSSEQLRCFCTRMHVLVWDDTLPPVMTCDGREMALIALQEAGSEL